MTTEQTAQPVTGARASVAGAIVSSLAAYAFTILGARLLGDAAYAPVGVLWTVQYLVLTVGLLSLEAWITRDATVPAVAWRWIAGLSVGLGVVTAVTAPVMLGSASPAWPLTAAGVGVGFGLFVVARGISAAEGDLRTYGVLTGGESVLRLIVAVAVLAVLPTGPAVALTLPVGALAVALAFLAHHGRRVAAAVPQAPARPTPVPDRTGSATPFLATTTYANAVLQLLLAGGPLLTAAVGAAPAVTSTVFVTTSAARAPLALLYSGLLTRLLRAVHRSSPALVDRRLRQAVAASPLVVAAGGAVGWAIGPTLVALAFGQPLRPSATFAGLTAAAVVSAILLLCANQVVIARRTSHLLWRPWIVGLVTAAGLVALTGGVAPDLRAGLVTLGGMAVAGVLLSIALLRRR